MSTKVQKTASIIQAIYSVYLNYHKAKSHDIISNSSQDSHQKNALLSKFKLYFGRPIYEKYASVYFSMLELTTKNNYEYY